MDDETKLKMQALKNIIERRKEDKVPFGTVVPDTKSQNLAKGTLDKPLLRFKGSDVGKDLTEQRTVVSGTKTPQLDVKESQKVTDIGEFTKRNKDLDLKQRLKSSFKAAAEAGDNEMMDKLRRVAQKVGKGASKGLKMIPLVGTAASLMMSPDDASASVPILDQADSLGMSPQEENQMIAENQSRIDYSKSQAAKDREAALAKLAKLQK